MADAPLKARLAFLTTAVRWAVATQSRIEMGKLTRPNLITCFLYLT